MSISTLPPRGSKPVDEKEDADKGKFTQIWWGWFSKISTLLVGGFTGTITTAPLTVGGTTGSMTFQNGVLTARTSAT